MLSLSIGIKSVSFVESLLTISEMYIERFYHLCLGLLKTPNFVGLTVGVYGDECDVRVRCTIDALVKSGTKHILLFKNGVQNAEMDYDKTNDVKISYPEDAEIHVIDVDSILNNLELDILNDINTLIIFDSDDDDVFFNCDAKKKYIDTSIIVSTILPSMLNRQMGNVVYILNTTYNNMYDPIKVSGLRRPSQATSNRLSNDGILVANIVDDANPKLPKMDRANKIVNAIITCIKYKITRYHTGLFLYRFLNFRY